MSTIVRRPQGGATGVTPYVEGYSSVKQGGNPSPVRKIGKGKKGAR